MQLTREYKVPDNIGCGGQPHLTNINYLICAKVLSSEEASDTYSFSKITLDISRCEAKNDPKFIKALKKAMVLNFPQSDPLQTLELKLVK